MYGDKNAGKLRAEKLQKRSEGVAKEGKIRTISFYETLIEHKKSTAQQRIIKSRLNKGGIESLTRLLIKEQGAPTVLTNGKEI